MHPQKTDAFICAEGMKALFSGQHIVSNRSLRRGMALIGLSVLAHVVVLHWAEDSSILAWAQAASEPVITADIVEPTPTAASTVSPEIAKPPRKKKPHRVFVRPRPAHSAPAPAPSHEAVASSTVISAPEDSPSEPAKDIAQDAQPAPHAVDTPTPAPAVEKPASAPTPYKIDPPPSGDLHYKVVKMSVNGGSMSGRGRIQWHHEGDSYAIDGEISWLFITALKFSSEGAIDDYGVSPILYSQKSFRRAATDTRFQRERNIISFSASEDSYPRTGGEQDRASIIWQLASIGRADEAQFIPGKEFEIMVAGVHDAEPWQLRVIGKEEVSVGIGKVDAWHLVRTPKSGSYTQTLDIWLSPTHEWYPVKLRYTEPNGDHLDLLLSKIGAAVPN